MLSRIKLLLTATGCVFVASSMAQAQTSTRDTDREALVELSEKLEALYQQEHAAALAWAAQQGWPQTRWLQLGGGTTALMYLRGGRPIYYVTRNRNAADTVSTDELWPGGSSGLDLDGAGVVLHIWDGGEIRLSHQEFDGRVTWEDNTFEGLNRHSTHVAGTMVAQGQNASAHGMSNMATLEAFDFFSDTSEIAFAAAQGARVSNHSYGFATGWEFGNFGEGTAWYWFGNLNISTTEDYGFGFYSSHARDWDQIAYDAPRYMIVNAAGNDRGQSHSGTHFHLVGVNWVSSNDSHAADGGATGYDTISYMSGAKNILTVGNISDIIGGYTQPANISMWSTSSRGPTDDGRIKPDVVANGVELISCDIASDSDYATFTGTSMASPNTSGSLGLLLQHFRATHPTGAATESSSSEAAAAGGVLGACCLDIAQPCHCDATIDQNLCESLGGTFFGVGSTCDSVACDCNDNGLCDDVEIAQGADDCNSNGLIDTCEEAGFPCDPRSATLKALVIHTADERANPGPDYVAGWGLLNTLAAAEHITLDSTDSWAIQELSIAQGETITQNWLYDDSGDPFKATIVWTDRPGTPPPISVDPPDKMLVNDLDLRVIGPDTTVYEPWILDPANPSAAATKGDNDRDNVEVVIVETPDPGTYTVQITHKGTLVSAPQDFSLILSTATSEGCGSCQLYGDVFPVGGNCVADIDDILYGLGAFASADPCTSHPGSNLFPCGQACEDGVVDIDDVLSALAAFAGNFGCGHPCPPGACCLMGGECRDGSSPGGGMSRTDCQILGGTYQGDGTTCEPGLCGS